MEPQGIIETFLNRVRKRYVRICAARGTFLLLTLLTGGVLVGNLFAYYFPRPREFGVPFLIVFVGLLLFILYRDFIRGTFARFSPDDAALLTEKKNPQLKNALINSAQLGPRLDHPVPEQQMSPLFIRELLSRTREMIREIPPESVIDGRRAAQSRNLFFGTLAALVLAVYFIPDLLPRGYSNWFAPPPQTAAAGPVGEKADSKALTGDLKYAIEDLALTFHYPAYTQLETRTVHPSKGEIRVLPGTEVRVTARTNLKPEGGELVLNNKDHLSMERDGKRELHGTLVIKEAGYYQFRVKGTNGKKYLLAKKYPIDLIKDRAPSIVVFLANPKPVYYPTGKVQFFYEGTDDFGISGIDLVVYVNGKFSRKSIKRLKGLKKEIKDGYTWNLSEMVLNPGDQIQYYLEIKDNDNVFGPNTGQSETYSFTVFDSRQERENLVLLQEEMTEKMIGLLAKSLVGGHSLADSPADLVNWKARLTSNADALIEIIGLAQRIQDRAKGLESFPRPYLNLLENIISGLTRIRKEHIDTINEFQNMAPKPTPVGYTLPPFETINGRLVDHLEKDILFLVKMTNRQKLDQVMDLEKHLTELTESLREEFENIKNKKAPETSAELMSKIDQMRKTLQKIMDQLARQTQALPDEFLNPNAFKHLNMDRFNASLNRLRDLVREGKMDEALEELEKLSEDLRTMANQLEQARNQSEDLIDMKIMEQLDDSLSKILELEKQEKRLLDETTQINQSLRKAQSKSFEADLEAFFESLRRDVNEIQSILDGDEDFLEQHPTMKKLDGLMDREARLSEKIRKLGQRTVDTNQAPHLGKNFKALNEARRKLSGLAADIDSLRVHVFNRFKRALPEILQKYETLAKLTELYDLNEFNTLFKNTYPEVFRWQNSVRTTPNSKEDIAGRMEKDLRRVTHLNSEISKKLGSMMRSLNQDFQARLSDQNKADMEKMAGEQNQMFQETQKLADRFAQMSRQNPMLTRDLSSKMSRTGRHMERAETRLKEHNVQKSINSENRALRGLQEMRDMLNDIKNGNQEMARRKARQSPLKLGTGQAQDPRRGGSVRMQKEKVILPSEDQYHVPGAFREEILEAMKNHTPKNYERLVMEYYKELVK